MKYFVTIITCICFLHFAGQAQINLVLNPRFEEYSVCPDNEDEANYCNHWTGLDTVWSAPDWAHLTNGGIPEYCNVCAICGTCTAVTIPANERFYHNARSGNGMMQVRMYCERPDKDMVAKDYLQGHLSQRLIGGHEYKVTFYTVSEHVNLCAVNNIAAYLDDGTIDTAHQGGWTQTQCTPQVIDTNIISDTLNWTKIEGVFTANGTERLITIGNFTAKSDMHVLPLIDTTGISHLIYLFYLIDDISVIDCGNIPQAGGNKFIHPGDSVFLGTHETLIPYTWYVQGNPTPIDSGGGLWVKPSATTIYILEQDLCNIKKFDTVKIKVWPDTVTEVQPLIEANIMVYPNPTTGSVTIEGAKGSQMNVYDVVGREVLAGIIAGDKEIIHLEQLVRGVYVVQIVDPVTGLRLVRQVVRD